MANQHRQSCTCGACGGEGLTLKEQADVCGHRKGRRLIGAPDRPVDRDAVVSATVRFNLNGRNPNRVG
jgi:hypothetical protein